jgi:sodium-dependent dicarboxylate transporter 2/3/5
MWVSNTAATAMVYPVVIGIINVLASGRGEPVGHFARSPYSSALLLMTAYSASIFGVATPIGTATNVVALGYLRQPLYLGQNITFARWLPVGLPIAVVAFLLTALWLARLGRPKELNLLALRSYLLEEKRLLGPMKTGEINALIVFATVVSLWLMPAIASIALDKTTLDSLTRHCPEEMVAVLAPVLLFLLPVDWRRGRGTLEASDFAHIDWSTMLLFGAGLSLGNLMFVTGLAEHVGRTGLAVLGTSDPWAIAALAAAGGIVLSEFTSNAATASTLIPVVGALCRSADCDPVPALFAITFAASFGSALPVSTPPNAIVYGSGWIPLPRMIRAGLGVDIVGIVVILTILRLAYALGWRAA